MPMTRVRNMAGFPPPPNSVTTLKDRLFMDFQPSKPNLGKVAFYQEIADQLSKIAHKEPPWTWRYVQGFEHGTIKPGKKFMAAVNWILLHPPKPEKPAWLNEAVNNLMELRKAKQERDKTGII